MAAKSKAKKSPAVKKAPAKPKAKKEAPKKKLVPLKKPAPAKAAKVVAPKMTAAAKLAGKPVPSKKDDAKEPKAVAAPAKPEKVIDKKRAKAEAAMEAALAEGDDSSNDDEEFDPEKFFALNGGQGLIKSHTMRKERVDFNIPIRYRFLKGPLVYSAELINLSKGGLALKTTETIKDAVVIKVEIPLPHTSELFAVQAEVVWSDFVQAPDAKEKSIHTGLRFLPMSIAKQAVINQFIQQRRDEVIMAKIGLDRFVDSVPVAGLD